MLGERIRKWRHKHKMTLDEAAEHAKVDPGYLFRVEEGAMQPTQSLIEWYDHNSRLDVAEGFLKYMRSLNEPEKVPNLFDHLLDDD